MVAPPHDDRWDLMMIIMTFMINGDNEADDGNNNDDDEDKNEIITFNITQLNIDIVFHKNTDKRKLPPAHSDDNDDDYDDDNDNDDDDEEDDRPIFPMQSNFQ